ncbi:MAG: hypothetical protein NC300_11970 [Bacteroidales bacterium]|nr:hypothetical protein [Clostridium sp.]MCM1204848.1 hypothetical protein [Bacteroidales bacterium]
MDISNRHPLDVITKNNSLSMLEALIPFVDYPLKLPLALLIKFNEIRLIMEAFGSLNRLTSLGLHHPAKDPMDMLCSFAGISPEMLKMLMSMTEGMNGSFSPDILSQLNGNPDFQESIPSGEDDFDLRIQSILSEYDLQQAEQLQQEENLP